MYLMKLKDKKTGTIKTLGGGGSSEYRWMYPMVKAQAIQFESVADAKRFQKNNMLPYEPERYDLYLVHYKPKKFWDNPNIGLPHPENYPDFDEYIDDLTAWLGVDKLTPARLEEEKGRWLRKRAVKSNPNQYVLRLRITEPGRSGVFTLAKSQNYYEFVMGDNPSRKVTFRSIPEARKFWRQIGSAATSQRHEVYIEYDGRR